ncbi:ALPHA-MANNOSIDASE domain protein, partial [Mycobacterium xenopi 4042]
PAEQVGHRHPPRLGGRYTWPRFVCARPGIFRRCAPSWSPRLAPSPQTRDMNPIYTGKDVSFIDTKQANRPPKPRSSTPRSSPCSPGCWPRGLPAGRAGQGVGAAGLRRPPRRHHRLGVRPGLPRPAHRLARRVELGGQYETTRWRCCHRRSAAMS